MVPSLTSHPSGTSTRALIFRRKISVYLSPEVGVSIDASGGAGIAESTEDTGSPTEVLLLSPV